MYEPNKIKYDLYKRWFQICILLFIISIIVFIYLRFFSITLNKYTVNCFMLMIVILGWGVTAYAGMRSNKIK